MWRSVHVGSVEGPGGDDGRDAVEEEVDEAEAARSSDWQRRGHVPPCYGECEWGEASPIHAVSSGKPP